MGVCLCEFVPWEELDFKSMKNDNSLFDECSNLQAERC